jgi:hypothetical protein
MFEGGEVFLNGIVFLNRTPSFSANENTQLFVVEESVKDVFPLLKVCGQEAILIVGDNV